LENAPPTHPLAVQAVPLESIHLDPANVRTHPDRNLASIRESLTRFGQQKPIVVDRHGTIRAGNGTYLAAREMGWATIQVVVSELEGLEAAAYSVADNRTTDLSEFEPESLSKLLAELREEDALDGVGFDAAEIDEMLAELAGGVETDVEDPGAEDPPLHPTSRAGDLWILGAHRLLCGDSTKPEDVRRVMGEEQAKLVATDPPYLVDYTGERPNDSGKDWSGVYREVDIKDAEGFFRSLFTNALAVLAPHAAIYCWHAHKRAALIARIWEDLGIVDHQQIVWVKPTAVFGRVYWHFRHEPCVMGWKKGSQPAHDGHHEFDSVWEIDYDGKARASGDHPTQKPLEVFLRPMRKHTRPGDVCFEPFSGSGSQLVAAEKLGRKCRAIELSPAFVDVAVRRWEKATGEVAVLDGTGESFEEVAGSR